MSAYIVNLDHIAYLVQAGTSVALGMDRGRMSWYWGGAHKTLSAGNLVQAQRVGQMLWDENVRSVEHRYSADHELPGPGGSDYQYPDRTHVFLHIDPVQVLMSCDCYVYQACEHDGWETSEAQAYIDALRCRAWHSLPGYDDAVWGAPERKVQVPA